jgi:hypothetical protein
MVANNHFCTGVNVIGDSRVISGSKIINVVLMAAEFKISLFWNVTPCSLVEID